MCILKDVILEIDFFSYIYKVVAQTAVSVWIGIGLRLFVFKELNF